jgi:hypothetical protein
MPWFSRQKRSSMTLVAVLLLTGPRLVAAAPTAEVKAQAREHFETGRKLFQLGISVRRSRI